jgi:hypothetical protein
MRRLQLAEVRELHRRLMDQSGGTAGIRDLELLEASLAQPRQTFGGIDLYPELTLPWRSPWSSTELSLLPVWIPLKPSCWLLQWAS